MPLIAALLLLVPSPAAAYLGPGLGLGTIGIIVALLLSVILALIGLFWYPIKRRLRQWRSQPEKTDKPSESTAD